MGRTEYRPMSDLMNGQFLPHGKVSHFCSSSSDSVSSSDYSDWEVENRALPAAVRKTTRKVVAPRAFSPDDEEQKAHVRQESLAKGRVARVRRRAKVNDSTLWPLCLIL